MVRKRLFDLWLVGEVGVKGLFVFELFCGLRFNKDSHVLFWGHWVPFYLGRGLIPWIMLSTQTVTKRLINAILLSIARIKRTAVIISWRCLVL